MAESNHARDLVAGRSGRGIASIGEMLLYKRQVEHRMRDASDRSRRVFAEAMLPFGATGRPLVNAVFVGC
jgi:hypothetical protein